MTDDIWRTRLSSHFQRIQSHYYNITDSDAWPVAGLLVLLDTNGRPVRSELHLYEDLPSHIQEAAVRQARLVLQESYSGHEMVSLRILHTAQMREAMDVRLSLRPEALDTGPGRALLGGFSWHYLVLAGALVAVALVVWGILALVQPGSGRQIAGSLATEQEAAAASEADSGSGPSLSAADAPATPPSAALAPGDLPPSRNARPDIAIGRRVRILPGFSLTLRSEAGARAGEPVGFLTDEQTVVVVGGPLLAPGDADTIVWWLVELEDGSQAWAAANTSQTTLLVPAD